MSGYEAVLAFENGSVFEGLGFGAEVFQGGEAVFNTGMTGYQEIFTDPSYWKQIVVLTYPHIGNTGVNSIDLESKKIHLSGVVVRELCETPSNWRSEESLDSYLKKNQVPLISDVDTREITKMLRTQGAQRSILFPKKLAGGKSIETYAKEELKKIPSMDGLDLVSLISTKQPYDFGNGKAKLGLAVVYDYGVKTNILRLIESHGYQVKVVPYDFPFEETMALKPKAVVLSNGPGDPAFVPEVTNIISSLVGKVPLLAICMGHQLLARALGAETYKLKFGHHGINQPVKDLETGQILITSQNHGFAVSEKSFLSKDIKISHINLNDQTVEGFVSDKAKIYSVQFHPEAKPGPTEGDKLFQRFFKGFVQ